MLLQGLGLLACASQTQAAVQQVGPVVHLLRLSRSLVSHASDGASSPDAFLSMPKDKPQLLLLRHDFTYSASFEERVMLDI